MAEINGTLNAVIIGSEKVLHSTSATLTVDVDLPDTSTKDSAGWATHMNGIRNWDIAINGYYDLVGTGYTMAEILANIIARTADATIKFTTDGATGAVGWTGTATFNNAVLSGDHEQPMAWNASLKGNGALAAI